MYEYDDDYEYEKAGNLRTYGTEIEDDGTSSTAGRYKVQTSSLMGPDMTENGTDEDENERFFPTFSE